MLNPNFVSIVDAVGLVRRHRRQHRDAQVSSCRHVLRHACVGPALLALLRLREGGERSMHLRAREAHYQQRRPEIDPAVGRPEAPRIAYEADGGGLVDLLIDAVLDSLQDVVHALAALHATLERKGQALRVFHVDHLGFAVRYNPGHRLNCILLRREPIALEGERLHVRGAERHSFLLILRHHGKGARRHEQLFLAAERLLHQPDRVVGGPAYVDVSPGHLRH